MNTEGQLDLVMSRLKDCQENIARSGAEALDLERRQLEQELEHRELQGLLERRQKRVWKAAIQMLEDFAAALESGKGEEKSPWDLVRRLFSQASDEYEAGRDRCGQALEHAFDFLEAVFGTGQEMVIFITELNSSPACIHFLKEYDCPRYFQYNRSLLFEDQEQEVLNQITQMKGKR